jgi:hypothetical protein
VPLDVPMLPLPLATHILPPFRLSYAPPCLTRTAITLDVPVNAPLHALPPSPSLRSMNGLFFPLPTTASITLMSNTTLLVQARIRRRSSLSQLPLHLPTKPPLISAQVALLCLLSLPTSPCPRMLPSPSATQSESPHSHFHIPVSAVVATYMPSLLLTLLTCHYRSPEIMLGNVIFRPILK